MALIKIELLAPPVDGMDIKFQAPCDCTAVTGIELHYPAEDGSTATKELTFRDAHGNNLAGIGNLFAQGAYVKVIVDTENGYAYLQNADTNGYLESKLSMDLLWQNASPSSEFAGQDITVDWIQDYSMYIVGFKMNTNSGYYTWNILSRGDTGLMHDQINAISDDYPILFVARAVLLSTNGYVRFGDSHSRNVSGAVNVVNTRLIPIAIYGVKGVSA